MASNTPAVSTAGLSFLKNIIMNLTPELIAMFKNMLLNPTENSLDFKPMSECFEKSENVTAKHILFNQWIAYLQKPLPKIVAYIIMDEVFGLCDGKDENGLLGYHLKFIA